MELRLVCVIMPWSRGLLLSSLSKPSVAGSFKSSYAACGIRILQSPASPQWSRSGSASSKPPVPRPCPPDLRPCRRLPASTPPCARMICEPELSCAGMCKGNPEQAHGHDCEVSGQHQHILLSILQVTVRCACTLKACMSVWRLCFFYSRLAAINLECNIQVLTHSLHPLTERSAVLNCSHLNGTA